MGILAKRMKEVIPKTAIPELKAATRRHNKKDLMMPRCYLLAALTRITKGGHTVGKMLVASSIDRLNQGVPVKDIAQSLLDLVDE